jgi:hypothetical protein
MAFSMSIASSADSVNDGTASLPRVGQRPHPSVKCEYCPSGAAPVH